jgi:hypothetical protein
MQHDSAEAIRRLRLDFAPLRGMWPGFEVDLYRMGFTTSADLRGRDPSVLARDYCQRHGRPLDPPLSFCFAAIVRFAETGEAVPWWHLLRAQSAAELETSALAEA